MTEKWKTFFLWIMIFLLSVYIPVFLLVYFPFSYNYMNRFNSRIKRIGKEKCEAGVKELTGFFRYKNALTTRWNRKERVHFSEVRKIYDSLFFLNLAFFCLMPFFYEKRRMKQCSFLNMMLFPLMIFLFPFFGAFWKHVFHPLLFENDYWKISKGDLSYFLFPRSFFRQCFLCIIGTSFIVNLLIWFSLKRQTKELDKTVKKA